MNIDFHAHVYPQVYLETLKEVQGRYGLRLEEDEEGRIRFYHRGFDFGPISATGVDPAPRLADLDAANIDFQVLTMGNPSIDLFESEDGVPLMRAINDAIAEMVRMRPDRLAGFACIGLKDLDAAVEEMRRAARELELKGCRAYEPVDFERAIRIAAAGQIDLKGLVSEVVPLGEAAWGFEQMQGGGQVLKVLLDCRG